MRWLVIYDIRDRRRLARVAKVMKDYGIRVQKSKFEVDITQTVFEQMCRRLTMEIDSAVDGIKLIPLCRGCRNRVEAYGPGGLVAPEPDFRVL